jgi:hypothetical protein
MLWLLARCLLYILGWKPLLQANLSEPSCLLLFLVTSEWDYFFYGLYVLAYPKRMARLYLLDPTQSQHPPWAYFMPVIPIGTRLGNLPKAWRHVRIIAFDYHHHRMFWGEIRQNHMQTQLQSDLMQPILYRSNYPVDVSLVDWSFLSQRLCGGIFLFWCFTQSWLLFILFGILYLTLFWRIPEWCQYRLLLLTICVYGLEFASQLSLIRLGFGLYFTWRLQHYISLIPLLLVITLIIAPQHLSHLTFA